MASCRQDQPAMMSAHTRFSIRSARLDDAGLLPAIERSAGAVFLALPELSWLASGAVLSAAFHRETIANGTSWVVASEHDAPVAFLSAERIGGNLHIAELAVHSDFQRRGLGRALIEHATGWAKAQGLPAITLTTFRDIPWNEPFYQTLGFTTMDAANLSPEMERILDEEALKGLPRDRRCAMINLIAVGGKSFEINSM